MSLVAQLGSFIASLQLDDVPGAVRTKLGHHVLDSLGVILAGTASAESGATRNFIDARPGAGEAAIFGTALRTLAGAAAFANTFHGRINTYDDTFEAGPLHPGTCVVSVALAAAESAGASGRRALEAALAGYETAIRISEAFGAGHYETGFHTTGTLNAFGAAAAAARAYGLDAQQTTAALALAGEGAAGVRQHQVDGGMVGSALNGARAARVGIEAAQLARSGLTGPPEILEGRFGLFRLMAGKGDAAAIERDLGRDFRFMQTSLKPYPTCRFTHGPIHALRALAREHGLRADDIESIEIATFRQSIDVSDRPEIRTRSEAILSHQYAAALGLTRERLTLDDLGDATRNRPDLRALAARVRVVHDAELDAQYPARWPHRITVRCKDGRTLREISAFPPGGPDDPLSDESVRTKFDSLAAPVIGREAADQVSEAVRALASQPNVERLVSLLQPR